MANHSPKDQQDNDVPMELFQGTPDEMPQNGPSSAEVENNKPEKEKGGEEDTDNREDEISIAKKIRTQNEGAKATATVRNSGTTLPRRTPTQAKPSPRRAPAINPYEVSQTKDIIQAATRLNNIRTKRDGEKELPIFLYKDVGRRIVTKQHPVVILKRITDITWEALKAVARPFGKVKTSLSKVENWLGVATIVFKREADANNFRIEATALLGAETEQEVTFLTEDQLKSETTLTLWWKNENFKQEEIEEAITVPFKAAKILTNKDIVIVTFFRRQDLEEWKRTPVQIQGKTINKKEGYKNSQDYELFARKIPFDKSNSDVKIEIATQVGIQVKGVMLMRDQASNRSKGCGIIKFETATDMRKAWGATVIIAGQKLEFREAKGKRKANPRDPAPEDIDFDGEY